MTFAYFVADDIGAAAIDAYRVQRDAWYDEAYALCQRLTGSPAASISESFGIIRLDALTMMESAEIPAGFRAGGRSVTVAGLGKVRPVFTNKRLKAGKDAERQIQDLNARAPLRPLAVFGVKSAGVIVRGVAMAWPTVLWCGDVRVLAVPTNDDGSPSSAPIHARRLATWEWEYLKEHEALPPVVVRA